ncbi:site-specific DNA-methyltransferase [Streptococcus sp.]|uniref:DNA methyltransferase n=1 Tax=Streptococcus sp. TaxID=1306 RepID=UPI001D5E1C20|nr:site-specific DNA-methyltransferase [Streptococcus sp.]MBS6421501.1 site-specific DNA-methyltransferase [Streptococcus sp.]
MKKELERLLAQNDTFMVEGVLNKNKLAELARQYNPELLNLLMSDEKISNHFFSTLETGSLIFKKDVFLQFLNNKEFLPDSFTAYKTKIGLATGDKYLSENQEVVLNFPYKDCVLEGGQTKDDAKRQEIFFNETLAPTEINRLLDDKVLTNFKRYDETGEHNVEEIKDTDNLIIKGNNLIVLHSLKKRFAGKVKLIYIDPPYNTGNDSFKYNDKFNHSTWLTFMKNRLEIAKTLLADDGVLFVHCDYNEDGYLRVLLDEIFTEDNFVANITVRSNSISGNKTQHKEKTILKNKDTILVYKKNSLKINPQYTTKQKWDTHYNAILISEDGKLKPKKLLEHLIEHKVLDPKEKITENSWGNEKFRNFCIENMNFIYRIVNSISESLKQESLKQKDTVIVKNNDGDITYALNGKRLSTLNKTILNMNGKMELVQLLGDLWGDIDFQNTQNEGGVSFPTGKKPEALLRRIIDMTTKEGDVVLDYHLGSGTTAAVAHKMNRQYIGIEQMSYIETLAVERLKKVIEGERGGISKAVSWTGGGSFVYAELKNDAQDFKNAISEATTTEELLELFEMAKKSSFLSYRIDPKKLKQTDFELLSLAEQKQILSEIIDNNNLYVNYSDIDDRDYGISDEDKKLNHAFYGKEQ